MTQSQEIHRPPLRRVLESYVAVSVSAYSARAGDHLIGVNRSGAVTITLPSAEVRPGRVYTVKDESGGAASNNITVATEGSETIDGSATDVISENYGSKNYYSDGSNWFTVPLLAAASVAHSATTGQGTDDHHAKAHQSDHNSAGADALKLDDLSAPDDNTDLDFSTSAHGLVPKGPNTGNFLKDDGSWAAAGGGGDITREGSNTTVSSSTSNTAGDRMTVSSLTIAVKEPFEIVVSANRDGASSAESGVGLKLNTTVVGEAALGARTVLYFNNAAAETQEGAAWIRFGARDTNQFKTGTGNFAIYATGSTTARNQQPCFPSKEAACPNAEITDIILRGISDGTAALGIDSVHVYAYKVS